MALTEKKTEVVPGRITHVYIGKNSTTGVDIIDGIVSFEYRRIHEAKPANVAKTKTTTTILQAHSNFTWKLKFISDCRVAFFDTDVTAVAGQKAMDDNGDSYAIAYFRVIIPIEDGSGANKTRTYTITNGYALQNHAYIGDDEDAIYEYEGIAEYISYSDA